MHTLLHEFRVEYQGFLSMGCLVNGLEFSNDPVETHHTRPQMFPLKATYASTREDEDSRPNHVQLELDSRIKASTRTASRSKN